MKTFVCVALAAACLGLGAAPARAADPVSLQNSLEEWFGIFLINKERRSPQDRIFVSGNEQRGFSAEISHWRSLQSRDPAEEVCNAHRWLLLGRGKYGKGAAEAFARFPSLQQIELKFFDIESGTKPGKKKGEIVPTAKTIPYLKIGVERRSLLGRKANWEEVKNQMTKGKCSEVGGRYLDTKWTDGEYLRQGRKI